MEQNEKLRELQILMARTYTRYKILQESKVPLEAIHKEFALYQQYLDEYYAIVRATELMG